MTSAGWSSRPGRRCWQIAHADTSPCPPPRSLSCPTPRYPTRHWARNKVAPRAACCTERREGYSNKLGLGFDSTPVVLPYKKRSGSRRNNNSPTTNLTIPSYLPAPTLYVSSRPSDPSTSKTASLVSCRTSTKLRFKFS